MLRSGILTGGVLKAFIKMEECEEEDYGDEEDEIDKM